VNDELVGKIVRVERLVVVCFHGIVVLVVEMWYIQKTNDRIRDILGMEWLAYLVFECVGEVGGSCIHAGNVGDVGSADG